MIRYYFHYIVYSVNSVMKVYRKYQQREYERIEHPNQFPPDYFFSALAELVLDD